MKVGVDADELYPWFTVSENPASWEDIYEVDRETFKRWQAAGREYFKMQEELRDLIGWDQ